MPDLEHVNIKKDTKQDKTSTNRFSVLSNTRSVLEQTDDSTASFKTLNEEDFQVAKQGMVLISGFFASVSGFGCFEPATTAIWGVLMLSFRCCTAWWQFFPLVALFVLFTAYTMGAILVTFFILCLITQFISQGAKAAGVHNSVFFWESMVNVLSYFNSNNT